MYVEEIILSHSLFLNPWHKVDHRLFTVSNCLKVSQGECLYNMKMTFNFVPDYLYKTPYCQWKHPNQQSLMIAISASICHCKTGVNIDASYSWCKLLAHKKSFFNRFCFFCQLNTWHLLKYKTRIIHIPIAISQCATEALRLFLHIHFIISFKKNMANSGAIHRFSSWNGGTMMKLSMSTNYVYNL